MSTQPKVSNFGLMTLLRPIGQIALINLASFAGKFLRFSAILLRDFH
jgi:hypothetical protein